MVRRVLLHLGVLLLPGFAHGACMAPMMVGPTGTYPHQRYNITAAGNYDLRSTIIEYGWQTYNTQSIYPFEMPAGTGPICVQGGTVKGVQSKSLSWTAMKHNGWDGDAIHVGKQHPNEPSPTSVIIDGIAILNVEDGFSPRGAGNHSWTVRGSYFNYIRDDTIENDGGPGGLFDSNLVDSTFVFYSERPVALGPFIVTNSLIHIARMPCPCSNNSSTPPGAIYNNMGNGQIWKLPTAGSYPSVTVINTIFYMDGPSINGYASMLWPKGTFKNVTLIYGTSAPCQGNWPHVLGSSGCYPDETLPKFVDHGNGTWDGVKVISDTSIWTNARLAWLRSHSLTPTAVVTTHY